MSTISERTEESESSGNSLFRSDSPVDQNKGKNEGQGESTPSQSQNKDTNPNNVAGGSQSKAQGSSQPTPPPGKSVVEVKETNLQIVRKHMRDVEKGSGYIKLSGKPDIVLQIQDGYATMKKKKPVQILEPL